jgi:magnesium-transporting ATPase (P-type)
MTPPLGPAAATAAPPSALPTAESPGLSPEEAARRLAQDGPNEVAAGTSRRALRILRRQLESPLVLVLIGVAGVSRLLGESVEAMVILLVVALNAVLGFVQEYRAERAWTAAAIGAVARALPYTGVGNRWFEFVPVSGRLVGLIGLVLALYLISAEVAKRTFFRRMDA